MKQPKFYDYLYPVLKVLEHGRIVMTRDIYIAVAEELNLSEETKSEILPSGNQPVYQNRIGWARTYLGKAGLIHKCGYGKWQISERGKKILTTSTTLTLDQLYEHSPDYKNWKDTNYTSPVKQESDPSSITEVTPDEQMESAFLSINSQLKDEILEKILENDYRFFEYLILDLMEKMNYGTRYDNGRVMKMSNDGGIDGIINQDILGLDKIYLQAKRYKQGNNVGAPEMQGFVGSLAMHGATKGVFVTTSHFTQQALEVIQLIKDKTIIAIDGNKLLSLMIEFNLGVSTKHTYNIKKIDIDYFNVE